MAHPLRGGSSTCPLPPSPQVLEGAWPILSGVAQAPVCQSNPLVVEALCEVYQRSLLSAKQVRETSVGSHSGNQECGPMPHTGPPVRCCLALTSGIKSLPPFYCPPPSPLAGRPPAAAGTHLLGHDHI